jgi:hypothetical protein
LHTKHKANAPGSYWNSVPSYVNLGAVLAFVARYLVGSFNSSFGLVVVRGAFGGLL